MRRTVLASMTKFWPSFLVGCTSSSVGEIADLGGPQEARRRLDALGLMPMRVRAVVPNGSRVPGAPTGSSSQVP